ncbi:insulinase family protein [Sphingopyxis sp. YR583]|uniref:insulinase family protein n=1 Tax=Sphingopyxis sp. YR583 TaxID=1881047 RepID=UPI0015A716BF|nr:insulinase family protein [Sphingopyxis sp. YR583]
MASWLAVCAGVVLSGLAALPAVAQENLPAAQLAELRGQIRAGSLSNGFRYVIAPTGTLPAERQSEFVSVVLHVDTNAADGGDLMELPHLLEHMLALHTMRAPDGKLIKRIDFPKYFGAPSPFFANPDKYGFTVPRVRVTEAIGHLRTIAHGANFQEHDIVSEINIVKSEILMIGPYSGTGLIVSNMAKSSSMSRHTVKARLESLRKTRVTDVLKFYADRYRANNEILYIVGNVDAERVEREIIRRFSDMPGGGSPASPLLPSSDLTRGPVDHLPGIRGSTSMVLLGYRGDEAADSRRQTVQIVLAQALMAEMAGRSGRIGFPARDVQIRPRLLDGTGSHAGIDIIFSSLSGEFSPAFSQIAGAIDFLSSESAAGAIERAKSDIKAATSAFDMAECLRQDSIYADLVRASENGRFGQPDCRMGMAPGEVDSITIAEVRAEMRRLSEPRNLGFVAVAPLGDREVGLRNIRKILAHPVALSGQDSASFNGPAELPEIIKLPRNSAEPKLLPIRDNLYRLAGADSPPIFVEKEESGAGFGVTIFGSSVKELLASEQALAPGLMRLARLSGFGGLDAEQMRAYLKQNQLNFDVRIQREFSSIVVSGPSDKQALALNLLHHLVRGPDSDDLATRELKLASLDQRCGANALVDLAERAMGLGLMPPASLNGTCAHLTATPDAKAARSIWTKIFGNSRQWTLVARGAVGPDLLNGLRSLKHAFPSDTSMSQVRSEASGIGSLPIGRQFITKRGDGSPQASVRIYIPLHLDGVKDVDGFLESLGAIFPPMGKFWHRLRVEENGAYSPGTSIQTFSGRPDHIFLVVNFVCDPSDIKRLIEATWNEFSKLQSAGLDVDDAARIMALKPANVKLIDELQGPGKYSFSEGNLNISRVIMPAEPDRVLKAIRSAKREEIIIFSLVS